jgi:hypothetical protein
MWKLFLDDIRSAPDDYIQAKSTQEAVSLIERKGFPIYISFDHDLGENDTSIDFFNIIVDKVLDGEWIIAKNFRFDVHSDNYWGHENIKTKMNALLKDQRISFQLKKSKMYLSR